MEKSYKFKYQSSKKALEAINRFNYYTQEIVSSLFDNSQKGVDKCLTNIDFKLGSNNLMYFWKKSFLEGEVFVNQQSIMHSIKATYLNKKTSFDDVLKINQKSYQKVSKILGGFRTPTMNISEIIEFVIKNQQVKASKKIKHQLYIIHHCQNQIIQQNVKQLKWNHFVQKYYFDERGISYEVVAVANQEKSLFGFYSNQRIILNFVKQYLKFQSFQGCLLKYQDGIKSRIKQTEDPAFSEQHKVINQIPTQFVKMFYNLKNQFGADKEELICRYMIAREFNLQQTRTSLKQYLQWHAQITKKYKWEDFQQFHKMNIYYYLGQDYKGRPVILNMARNVMVDQMDQEKYCIYFLYYLEIYLPTKMRGYVTQCNIIADVEGITQKNFKWAITKRNTDEGKKFCVQRQFKFFAVNVSSFAYFCWRCIQPLLPKKTQQKVQVGGSTKQTIVQSLLKDMSIDVIPTYLGGKNPLI